MTLTKQQEAAILAVIESSQFEEKLLAMIVDAVNTSVEKTVGKLISQMERKYDELWEKKDVEIRTLNTKITELETLVKEMQQTNELEKTVNDLTISLDTLEQYSRKNCLLIKGLDKNVNPMTHFNQLVNKLNIQDKVTAHDLDNVHWMGEKIVVKFNNYPARDTFYRKKKEFGKGIFVNEQLTKRRDNLFFKCRLLKKEGKIQGTWTTNGNIKVRINDNNHTVSSIEDVHKLL